MPAEAIDLALKVFRLIMTGHAGVAYNLSIVVGIMLLKLFNVGYGKSTMVAETFGLFPANVLHDTNDVLFQRTRPTALRLDRLSSMWGSFS